MTPATKFPVRSATMGCIFIFIIITCSMTPGPTPAKAFAKPTAKFTIFCVIRVLVVYLRSPLTNLKPTFYFNLSSLS